MPATDATWDEWAEAAKKVAESQQVPIALALDRSGHRLAGPAISMAPTTSAPTACRRRSTTASRPS